MVVGALRDPRLPSAMPPASIPMNVIRFTPMSPAQSRHDEIAYGLSFRGTEVSGFGDGTRDGGK